VLDEEGCEAQQLDAQRFVVCGDEIASQQTVDNRGDHLGKGRVGGVGGTGRADQMMVAIT
jgi:hypothetical protein